MGQNQAPLPSPGVEQPVPMGGQAQCGSGGVQTRSWTFNTHSKTLLLWLLLWTLSPFPLTSPLPIEGSPGPGTAHLRWPPQSSGQGSHAGTILQPTCLQGCHHELLAPLLPTCPSWH